MRKFTLALIAALIPVSAMSADFSGTWVRDSARSKPVPYPNYWLTRVTPGAGGGQNQLYVMRIQQSATDVQISTTTTARLQLRTLGVGVAAAIGCLITAQS